MTEYILIGGAPLTGKTSLAKKLSRELNCNWLACDSISVWMANLVRREDYIELFYDLKETGKEMSAEEFYRLHPNPADVYELEKRKQEHVQQGVESLIDAEFPWDRVVVEGIAITPEFAKSIQEIFPNSKFTFIFLYDDNGQRIKDRLYSRGLYDSPEKYEDWIKTLELEWVKLYNQYFKGECEKYSLQLTELDKADFLNLL